MLKSKTLSQFILKNVPQFGLRATNRPETLFIIKTSAHFHCSQIFSQIESFDQKTLKLLQRIEFSFFIKE
jgi:hypothetical protein